MKVVILCGGFGTRLREQMGLLPKPLVEVGGRPILWHVMQIYAAAGFTDFLLCLGFGGSLIEEHLLRNPADFPTDWRIEFSDTGVETQTGGRIKRIERFLGEEPFFVTYADGVADLDLRQLLAFHRRHGRIGTMTVVNPVSQFGEVVADEEGRVRQFSEKPRLNRWVNGGFFVFNPPFLGYLTEKSVLEKQPLESVARDDQLYAFRHNGFWCCMDTYKDTLLLNDLCKDGVPPWIRRA